MKSLNLARSLLQGYRTFVAFLAAALSGDLSFHLARSPCKDLAFSAAASTWWSCKKPFARLHPLPLGGDPARSLLRDSCTAPSSPSSFLRPIQAALQEASCTDRPFFLPDICRFYTFSLFPLQLLALSLAAHLRTVLFLLEKCLEHRQGQSCPCCAW